jgi:hypothetical protein
LKKNVYYTVEKPVNIFKSTEKSWVEWAEKKINYLNKKCKEIYEQNLPPEYPKQSKSSIYRNLWEDKAGKWLKKN